MEESHRQRATAPPLPELAPGYGVLMASWQSKRNIEYLSRPPGQTETSVATSTANRVKDAIKAEAVFKDRRLDVFLQGSYANSTNISGGSDVDVVSKLEDTYYYEFFDNVDELARQRVKANMGGTPVTYDWTEYRRDLLAALQAQFPGYVIDGNKAIKVNGTASGSRLPADVVPCVTFRMYRADGTFEEGICFWRKDARHSKVSNFPKQHRNNMSSKNGSARAGPKFKGLVRAMKRLRDEIDPLGSGLAREAASYWIECLMYNVPDDRFRGSYDEAMLSCLSYLYNAVDNEDLEFVQANDIYLLFHAKFWSRASAKKLVDQVWDAAFETVP